MGVEIVEEKAGPVAIRALLKAQIEMARLIKNSVNPHLKSRYADLSSVLESCRDALVSNGFCILQKSGQDQYGPFVQTILYHESGEELESTIYLVNPKGDMQGLGSAITYARRYNLLILTGLVPEDDDGNDNSKPVQPKVTPNQKQESKPEPKAAPKNDTLEKIKALVENLDDSGKDRIRDLVKRARNKDGSYNMNALTIILDDLREEVANGYK